MTTSAEPTAKMRFWEVLRALALLPASLCLIAILAVREYG